MARTVLACCAGAGSAAGKKPGAMAMRCGGAASFSCSKVRTCSSRALCSGNGDVADCVSRRASEMARPLTASKVVASKSTPSSSPSIML